MGEGAFGRLGYAIDAVLKTRREAGYRGISEELKWAAKFPLYSYLSLTAPDFQFWGRKYPYLYHPYNNTWRNERCVEVPIAWEEVMAARGKRVLEVGNVLSHYYPVRHEVVDKYEKAAGVLNVDAVDFTGKEPYDLIVSISTLEHVGWDEAKVDGKKIMRALSNLQKNCARGGRMLVTFGLGHSPYADGLAMDGNSLPGWEWGFLKRESDGRWAEAGSEAPLGAKYDFAHATATCVAIGRYISAAKK